MALVCKKHSSHKYYQLYGSNRCPEGFLQAAKRPNLGQVCIQGGGGRPVMEEGMVQSNAQNMKRSRAKADEVKVKLVQSCYSVGARKG